jgi:molybdopterin/thiamine biosynthesis adenylyltransferase
VVGCLQALEAIKVATAVGEPLCGRMLLFDALAARIKIVCNFIFHIYCACILFPELYKFGWAGVFGGD